MTAFKTVLLVILVLVAFTTILSIIGFVFSLLHVIIDLIVLAGLVYVTYLYFRRRPKRH